MNKPIFDENDLKIFFDSEKPAEPTSGVVDVKPETQVPIKTKMENFAASLAPKPHPQTETDLFSRDFELPKNSIFKTVGKFIGIFILIFVISFSIVNGPALIQQFKFFYETEFRNQSWASNAVIPRPVANINRIIIPQIKVDAPITWEVADDKMNEALENGVAHYKSTALPGEIGNVFITGHSSYYIWAKGSYKDVFALLDKLQAGDKIYIQYKGANFIYEVANKQVVSPTNISVLNQTDDKTLSLMTCVPVGTNLRRLIVTAKQIPN